MSQIDAPTHMRTLHFPFFLVLSILLHVYCIFQFFHVFANISAHKESNPEFGSELEFRPEFVPVMTKPERKLPKCPEFLTMV